jgi:DNA-directed RNA polymerase specialized sigma24 family protein
VAGAAGVPLMRRVRRPWLLDRSQRWRLRYRRLWPGPGFDREDPSQTYRYALQRLSKTERAVFLLSRFSAMDYADIARTLGLSPAVAEWRLVGALYKMTCMLDLIDRARSRQSEEIARADQEGADR